jgi:hypothetical protein
MNNQYTFLFFPFVLHAPPIRLFDLIIPIILGEEHKLRSSTLCSLLYPPITLSPFGSNILFSPQFSNTFNLCSYHNVRNQVSHP